METTTVGRVTTEATIESLEDLWATRSGGCKVEDVRKVTVPDALVDTGASSLSLLTRSLRELGLEARSKKRVTSSSGVVESNLYDPVRLTIQGREYTMDVMEVPNDVPVLIGQIPLEHLDFVI